MTVSVTISRTSLSLDVLTIGDDQTSTYMMTRDGLTEPAPQVRYSYADPSPHVAGNLPTQAVLDGAFIGMTVRVRAATDAALATAVTALEAAVRQFAFTSTITKGATVKVWTSHMAVIVPRGEVQVLDILRHEQTFNITIPVQPVSA